MARLKIKDAPLLPIISGDEKIPTGGKGDFTLTPDMLAEHFKSNSGFATDAELTVVDNKLKSHTDNKNNPHQTTKAQVGLDSVDNTSDIDKPVSNATSIALDTKADKTQVIIDLNLKADKSTTYTKTEVDSEFYGIYQNGASLPYDAAMEYAEGAVVVKDGELQQWKDGEWMPAVADSTIKYSILNDSTSQSLHKKLGERISVMDFGAKGDSVTDDTIAIQNAFVYAYYNKRSVIFPAGDYLISKPILVFVTELEHLSSINVSGESMARTRIICSSSFSAHLSSGLLAETAAFIAVNETFLNLDGSFKDGTGRAHGVYISDMTLLCRSSSAKYGILLPVHNALSSYKRLLIQGFSNAGIKNFNHFYLNIIEKVRIQNSPIGFDQELGIKTSVKYDSCYVVGADDKAYHVGGNYMNMTNCCADGCTGTIFHLRGFMGVIINPGSESHYAKKMFYAGQ